MNLRLPDPDRNLTHVRGALGRAGRGRDPANARQSSRTRACAGGVRRLVGRVVRARPSGPAPDALTYPVLERAPKVLWLITGADKVDALARLRAGDIADETAAGGAAR